jgi:hypothetical protein
VLIAVLTDPEKYCAMALQAVAGFGYGNLPEALLRTELALRDDPAARAELNRQLCGRLLERFVPALSGLVLPPAFIPLYEQQLARIAGVLRHQPDAYFVLSNDVFRKDLAILRGRLIPCGAEFFTPFSGLSRGLALKRGGLQLPSFLRVLLRAGGSRPFLELHMHPQVTDRYNPSGWLETYTHLADILHLNPGFRGVQSTSWFLDPEMARVSPHLAYLRQVPQRAGAAFFYAGEDNPATSGAFATSEHRRELYRQGRYRPRLYTRIWPRARLLQRRWQSA